MNGFLQVTNIDGSPIPIPKVIYTLSNGDQVYDNGMSMCFPENGYWGPYKPQDYVYIYDGAGSGIPQWGSWSPLLGTSTTEPNKGEEMYVTDIEEDFIKLQKENEELKTAMVRLENEIRNKNYAQLDAKLTKEANENLSKSTFDLRKERDELKKALDFHNVLDKTRKNSLYEESQRLRSEGINFEDLVEVKQAYDDLHKQAGCMNISLNKKTIEIEELKQKLATNNGRLRSCREGNEELKEKNKQLESFRDHFVRQTITPAPIYEDAKSQIKEFHLENQALQEELKELQETYDSSEVELSNAQLELKNFKEMFEVSEEKKIWDKVMTDFKERNKVMLTENQELRERIVILLKTRVPREDVDRFKRRKLKTYKMKIHPNGPGLTQEEFLKQRKIDHEELREEFGKDPAVEHKLKYWCNEAAKFQKERDELKKNLDVETEEHTNLKKAMDLIRKNHLTVPSYQYIPNPYPLIRY